MLTYEITYPMIYECLLAIFWYFVRIFKEWVVDIIFWFVFLIILFILSGSELVSIFFVEPTLNGRIKLFYHFDTCYVYVYDAKVNYKTLKMFAHRYFLETDPLFVERTLFDMNCNRFNCIGSKIARMFNCYRLNFIEDQTYSLAYRVYYSCRTHDVVFEVTNYTGDPNYKFFN